MADAAAPTGGQTHSPSGAEQALGFGTRFTDHMLLAEYNAGLGWHDARVVPYGPLPLDPATMALHYGQTIFEGLKAFRGEDGAVRLFRPHSYLERLVASAKRMCMAAPAPLQLLP